MIPKELERVRDSLAEGQAVNPVTVRNFLSWFEAKRRGVAIVEVIRKHLDDAKLYTIPDFEEPWLDSPISFARIQIVAGKGSAAGTSKAEAKVNAKEVEIGEAPFGWEPREAGYRLSRLEAANKVVVSVGPEEEIATAVTKMMLNDYSQLPVMIGDRDVKGVITWSSIGSRAVLQGVSGRTADFMEPPVILDDDGSIFEAIPVIVRRDFVLIRSRDRRISGIVTAADLSLQFRMLTEPFLLLSEIETYVRNMIGKKFTPKELGEVRDPNSPRTIKSVADLTFGEYVRLLQRPDNWARMESRLDRATVCGQLEKVSMIRNQVMHFDPDGLEEGHLEILREFSLFLKRLEGLVGPKSDRPGPKKD